MKKILLAILIIVIIALIYVYTGFNGNIISKEISKNTTRNYVEENHPNEGYEFSKISYSFKTRYYEVTYKKPNSLDEYFNIHTDSFGKIIEDDYDMSINNKWNTYNRLNEEIVKQTDSLLKTILPELDTSFAYMNFSYNENFANYISLNQELDIHNPPIPMEVNVFIVDSDTSYEALARLIIEIEKSLSHNDIKAKVYNVNIQNSNDLENPQFDSVYAYQLQYEDWKIHKEDLTEFANFLKSYREQWDIDMDVK